MQPPTISCSLKLHGPVTDRYPKYTVFLQRNLFFWLYSHTLTGSRMHVMQLCTLVLTDGTVLDHTIVYNKISGA